MTIEGTVQTDALPIEIISLIEDAEAGSNLRDIQGAVQMIDPGHSGSGPRS